MLNMLIIYNAQCAKRLGIPYQPIEKCTRGPKGNHLEHKMAEKTNALQPPHTYVPWVTINGVGLLSSKLSKFQGLL